MAFDLQDKDSGLKTFTLAIYGEREGFYRNYRIARRVSELYMVKLKDKSPLNLGRLLSLSCRSCTDFNYGISIAKRFVFCCFGGVCLRLLHRKFFLNIPCTFTPPKTYYGVEGRGTHYLLRTLKLHISLLVYWGI